MRCLKKLWNSLRNKIMQCFDEFSVKGTFFEGLNSLFVALIPKVAQPKLVSDFKPISLINSIPKLFTNIGGKAHCSHW